MKNTVFGAWFAFFALVPGALFADQAPEETDSAHAPRVGLELGCGLGGMAAWVPSYENGGMVLCSAGIGFLDEHGGAMFRLDGGVVRSGLFRDKVGQNVLNIESLLWLPHKSQPGLDVYLAVGPMIQLIGNSARADAYAGVVTEAGIDYVLFDFLRLRSGLRSHLTYTNADVMFFVGTTFWSLPL